MHMFRSSNRGERYQYNALGDSLLSGEEGETEGVTSEEYQEEQRRSQNNHYPQHRHQDDAEGFGVELDQPRRGMMSDLSTSIRQRFQNLMGTNSGGIQPPPAGMGVQPQVRTLGVPARGETTHSGSRAHPTSSPAPLPQPTRGLGQAQPQMAALEERVSSARMAAELLRDTTQAAGRDPVDAVALADTLADLSLLCEQYETQLVAALGGDASWASDAAMSEAIQVTETLVLALEGYKAFAQGDGAAPGADAPVPPATGMSAADIAAAGESEEDMIARAIADSLKSEEERKARENQQKGAAPPPPSQPQQHLSPPSVNPGTTDTSADLLSNADYFLPAPPPSNTASLSQQAPTPPPVADPFDGLDMLMPSPANTLPTPPRAPSSLAPLAPLGMSQGQMQPRAPFAGGQPLPPLNAPPPTSTATTSAGTTTASPPMTMSLLDM
mmetsp:Transcript_4476/g.8314  ORF Transcript_4476/g.8314 Transcript_4476/m.8314 type:complete len:441 (-) Transcript_4476:458-1780(-)